MLIVVILSVIMLNVIILVAIMLIVFILNVVAPLISADLYHVDFALETSTDGGVILDVVDANVKRKPAPDVIKLLRPFRDKLERLYLASLSNLV
jgi:hypothetical protein